MAERKIMRMLAPFYSIITINYNDANGLQKTIESVVGQKEKDWEYLVIDGGSNDGSVDVIQKYSQHITNWVSEKDKGVYNAMNKGLEKANGQYVYFLNSGDTFFSGDVLKNISHFAKLHPSSAIIYGNAWNENEQGEIKKRKNILLSKVTLFERMICHQAIFAKRSLFINNGFFNENFKIKADYEWLLRNIFRGARHSFADIDVCIYLEGGLSQTAYNTVSVFEIPKVRKMYYSSDSEQMIRKYFINPKITNRFSWHLRNNFLLRLADKLLPS